jgi:dTDP-4-amino-4,6-dideoxygalactose transaminase
MNIDPARLDAAITEKTRAIIPVHLCGQTADMASILEIAERHRLYVIEDAAQAIGADYHGRRAGSLGHMGCLSFFPSKNLGGYGDSGMVLTNDAHLADRLKLLRNHGHRPKYYNQAIGGNFRMDELQAAVLRVKFRHLEDWIARRIDHAATYQRFFSSAGLVAGENDSGYISLPMEAGFGRHTYHLYQIFSSSRDDLRRWLHANGIGSEIYYPVPLHLQTCFHGLGYQIGDFPRSESAAQNSLALPIYPELTEEMQARIVDTVADFCTHSMVGQASSGP